MSYIWKEIKNFFLICFSFDPGLNLENILNDISISSWIIFRQYFKFIHSYHERYIPKVFGTNSKFLPKIHLKHDSNFPFENTWNKFRIWFQFMLRQNFDHDFSIRTWHVWRVHLDLVHTDATAVQQQRLKSKSRRQLLSSSTVHQRTHSTVPTGSLALHPLRISHSDCSIEVGIYYLLICFDFLCHWSVYNVRKSSVGTTNNFQDGPSYSVVPVPRNLHRRTTAQGCFWTCCRRAQNALSSRAAYIAIERNWWRSVRSHSGTWFAALYLISVHFYIKTLVPCTLALAFMDIVPDSQPRGRWNCYSDGPGPSEWGHQAVKKGLPSLPGFREEGSVDEVKPVSWNCKLEFASIFSIINYS